MSRWRLGLWTLLAVASSGVLLWTLARSQPTPSLPSPAITRLLLAPAQPPAAQATRWGIPLEPPAGSRRQHTHVALRIFWGQGAWPAPRNLGLSREGRFLALHTHDATGVVHLHRPPSVRPFTLGQLLELWGLPVRPGRLDGQSLYLWVNGRARPWAPDYVLHDRDDLVLEVATRSTQVPLPAFSWAQVPLAGSS